MNIVIILGLIITLLTGVPVLMQILKNHPRGLIILFFAEMWERFSYYGMRGILIFFLTQHFLFDDAMAGSTYGSYTSLVYLLPLVGGILADRYIGTRKAIAFGALLPARPMRSRPKVVVPTVTSPSSSTAKNTASARARAAVSPLPACRTDRPCRRPWLPIPTR